MCMIKTQRNNWNDPSFLCTFHFPPTSVNWPLPAPIQWSDNDKVTNNFTKIIYAMAYFIVFHVWNYQISVIFYFLSSIHGDTSVLFTVLCWEKNVIVFIYELLWLRSLIMAKMLCYTSLMFTSTITRSSNLLKPHLKFPGQGRFAISNDVVVKWCTAFVLLITLELLSSSLFYDVQSFFLRLT